MWWNKMNNKSDYDFYKSIGICVRQKLEELTGEKIEVEPSREEMIGKLSIDEILGGGE